MTGRALALCLTQAWLISSHPDGADPPIERVVVGVGGRMHRPRAAITVVSRAPRGWQAEIEAQLHAPAGCHYDFAVGRCTAPRWRLVPAGALRVVARHRRASVCVGACRVALGRPRLSAHVFAAGSGDLSERPLALVARVRPAAAWQAQMSISRRRLHTPWAPRDPWAAAERSRSPRWGPLEGHLGVSTRLPVGDGYAFARARGRWRLVPHRARRSLGLSAGWEQRAGGFGGSLSLRAPGVHPRVYARLQLASRASLWVFAEGRVRPKSLGATASVSWARAAHVRLLLRIHDPHGARAGRVVLAGGWGSRVEASAALAWHPRRALRWHSSLTARKQAMRVSVALSLAGSRPHAAMGSAAFGFGAQGHRVVGVLLRGTSTGRTGHNEAASGSLEVWLTYTLQQKRIAAGAL